MFWKLGAYILWYLYFVAFPSAVGREEQSKLNKVRVPANDLGTLLEDLASVLVAHCELCPVEESNALGLFYLRILLQFSQTSTASNG